VEGGGSIRAAGGAVALGLGAGLLLAIRLDRPAFFDNEGRYAEVAREMLLLGDWVTPHLDFSVFLNKPPLLYWLTAGVFHLFGPTEWARVLSVGAAVVTLVATCRVGALLYDARVGMLAGLLLATSLGFALEARTLRPDMLVVASTVAAMLCWLRAREPGRRAGRWLVAMYAVLGLGVLAKGLVPLVVVGIPIAVVTIRDAGLAGVRALRPGLGLAVLAAVLLPWHVAVARRNPGFAWDYVVNQHVLFFLDRKFPRDSEGDPLAFFWSAYAGRAFPAVLLAPGAVAEAVRGWSVAAARAARSSALVAVWAAGVLLFFSAAPSRLEHYCLPALPPTALLAARGWQRATSGASGRAWWAAFAALGGVALLVGLGGAVRGAAWLATTYWIAEAPGLLALAAPAGIVLALFGVAVVGATIARSAGMLVGTLAAGSAVFAVVLLVAESRAESLFSWRPVATALAAATSAPADVVFEAPEEYQIVGGLAYYAKRRIELLEPRGFIPPTYLAGRTATLFLPREEFARRWRGPAPMALVSDPQQRRDDPEGLAPAPYHVLAHFGDRWIVTNVAASVAR